MRRRGPGDGVVAVELLEGDDAFAPPSDFEDDAAAGPDAARARRLRWVGLAVVAVLLGTIVTATVIDGRRDAARRAALAELGWVLPALNGPLEEVWRASGGWVITETAGVLVVQEVTSNAVRALEANTGAVLWERDGGPGEFCSPIYDYWSSDPVRNPSADTLVCFTTSNWVGDGPPEPGATVTLVAVDVATGAELRPLVNDGALLAQDSVGDDLLVTFLDSDAAISVVRWDPRAGEVWSHRSAPGALADGVLWGPESGWAYGLSEDVLYLTDDLALDVDTGREVPADASDPEADFAGYVQELADGGRVEWRWDDEGSFARGRVLSPDGSLRFEVGGRPWSPWTTDGSVAEPILTVGTDGEAVAVDPITGDELWSVPGMRDSWPAYLLDGILVIVGPTTVAALDARDGTVLWSIDTRWAANQAAPTDGDVVLVQVSERPGAAILAVDLRTGVEVWRIPATVFASYWALVHAGDGFVLLTETEIVGFR